LVGGRSIRWLLCKFPQNLPLKQLKNPGLEYLGEKK
jgi:hypothetical protein